MIFRGASDVNSVLRESLRISIITRPAEIPFSGGDRSSFTGTPYSSAISSSFSALIDRSPRSYDPSAIAEMEPLLCLDTWLRVKPFDFRTARRRNCSAANVISLLMQAGYKASARHFLVIHS